MPINVSPRVRTPIVFTRRCPVGMRHLSRESHEVSQFLMRLASEAGGTDRGISLWRCDWLANVSSGRGGVDDKAGSSIHSSLSIVGMLFGIGEGETEGEVLLLAWEFGRDESDDELVLGDKPGILGSGLSEGVVDSVTIGLPSVAIAAANSTFDPM